MTNLSLIRRECKTQLSANKTFHLVAITWNGKTRSEDTEVRTKHCDTETVELLTKFTRLLLLILRLLHFDVCLHRQCKTLFNH